MYNSLNIKISTNLKTEQNKVEANRKIKHIVIVASTCSLTTI